MCTQMLMHMVAHKGCTYVIRESALKIDSGRKILQWGIEPVSVANRYDTVPPELHPTPLAAYTATVWTRLESELWHHPLQTQHLSAILPDDEPCSGAELSVVYICPKMAKCIDPMLSLSPAQKLLLV